MQNDMRDRLVEILRQKTCHYSDTPCDHECGVCGNVELYLTDIDMIADHLIANGVIVPPCNVGDKLYGFEYPRTDIVVINEETVEDVNIEIETNEGWYHISDVGKRVFLTKDQAEQKLKEMRVGNELL